METSQILAQLGSARDVLTSGDSVRSRVILDVLRHEDVDVYSTLAALAAGEDELALEHLDALINEYELVSGSAPESASWISIDDMGLDVMEGVFDGLGNPGEDLVLSNDSSFTEDVANGAGSFDLELSFDADSSSQDDLELFGDDFEFDLSFGDEEPSISMEDLAAAEPDASSAPALDENEFDLDFGGPSIEVPEISAEPDAQPDAFELDLGLSDFDMGFGDDEDGAVDDSTSAPALDEDEFDLGFGGPSIEEPELAVEPEAQPEAEPEAQPDAFELDLGFGDFDMGFGDDDSPAPEAAAPLDEDEFDLGFGGPSIEEPVSDGSSEDVFEFGDDGGWDVSPELGADAPDFDLGHPGMGVGAEQDEHDGDRTISPFDRPLGFTFGGQSDEVKAELEDVYGRDSKAEPKAPQEDDPFDRETRQHEVITSSQRASSSQLFEASDGDSFDDAPIFGDDEDWMPLNNSSTRLDEVGELAQLAHEQTPQNVRQTRENPALQSMQTDLRSTREAAPFTLEEPSAPSSQPTSEHHFDAGSVDDSLESDLGFGGASIEQTPPATPSPVPSAELDADEFDFDLGFDGPSIEEHAPAESPEHEEEDEFDFDLGFGGPSIEEPVPAAQSPVSPADLDDDEFDFDLGFSGPSIEEPVPRAASGSGMFKRVSQKTPPRGPSEDVLRKMAPGGERAQVSGTMFGMPLTAPPSVDESDPLSDEEFFALAESLAADSLAQDDEYDDDSSRYRGEPIVRKPQQPTPKRKSIPTYSPMQPSDLSKENPFKHSAPTGVRHESRLGNQSSFVLEEVESSPSVQPILPTRKLDVARAHVERGELEDALEYVIECIRDGENREEAQALADEIERKLTLRYERAIGELHQTPVLNVSMGQIPKLNLDHRSGFLISQIDGVMTYEDIVDLSSMSRAETISVLADLLERHVIVSA